MEYGIFVVYDRVAGIYSNMWLSVNKSTAQREFANAMAKNQYRDDMEMYRIGTFSNDTGCIQALEKPEFIVSAAALEENE